MKIKKTRINKLNNIVDLLNNQNIYVVTSVTKEKLCNLGYVKCEIGESVTPRIIGSASKYNIEGKKIVDKTQREVVMYTLPYNVVDWHGYPHSGFYERKVDRWKRTFISPLNEQLTIVDENNGNYTLSSSLLTINDSNYKIKTIINLMLEINNNIELVNDNYIPIIDSKNVSWKIFPPGDMPWEEYSLHISKAISKYSNDEINIIKDRYDYLLSLHPNNIICGTDGFCGYFIASFGDIYICDSIFLGNAAYILNGDWAEISKKTKKEIISANLALDRIIHRGEWKNKILSYIDLSKLKD